MKHEIISSYLSSIMTHSILQEFLFAHYIVSSLLSPLSCWADLRLASLWNIQNKQFYICLRTQEWLGSTQNRLIDLIKCYMGRES